MKCIVERYILNNLVIVLYDQWIISCLRMQFFSIKESVDIKSCVFINGTRLLFACNFLGPIRKIVNLFPTYPVSPK